MGTHAFSVEPEHCAVYRAVEPSRLGTLFGLADRWNMPAAWHRRALGPAATFTGVGHYVLTYHIGGSEVRRLDGDERMPRAGRGALSLQRPGSGGTFGSRGVVEYGHLYFQQSLLCEIGEEASLTSAAEPDDFFGLCQADLGADTEAYLRRAADCDDLPSAMEMDGRAYLVALSLLRVAERRRGGLGPLREPSGGHDLTRVMRAIDERLSEPLRLSDLALLVDLSPFHFARVFKARTGETPAQYLMRRRTERAVEMIRRGEGTLAEIAYRTGFSSQSHMSRRIKQATGVTPGALRSAT